MMFEKKGLHQATEILESYGIETTVSVLDRDDFYKLHDVTRAQALGCKKSVALVIV